MPDKIEPLNADGARGELGVFLDKLNEVIAAFNAFANPTYDNLTPDQREWVGKVESGEITIESVAKHWKVQFYDDLPDHTFLSPVCCVHCEYPSQNLLDRMLLNPRDLCIGCIDRTKNG